MSMRIRPLLSIVALACTVLQAQADTATAPLNFNAPTQNMWGGGSSFSFGAADEFNLIGPLSFGYNIGASPGTVSARFPGTLTVEHAGTLAGPGTATLSLDFTGQAGGGWLQSDLGAWAQVYAAGIDIFNEGYSLNVAESFTPSLGGAVTGDASMELAGYGLNVVVAKAGARLDIDQTDSFVGLAVRGTLDYSLRGSGQTQSTAFTLGAGGLDLGVSLNQPGVWDFGLRDLSLDNSFEASFDVALKLYEQHVDGINWCHKWIFYYPCGFSFDTNEVTLASIDIYDGDPFALSFGRIATGPQFSVAVIPEPGTLPMLALGLAVLGGLRWHQQTRQRRAEDAGR